VEKYGKIDSKFRFVILASKRAKQILRGAKVKIKSRSRNPIRIAQIEVKEGLIDYEVLQSKQNAAVEVDEQVISADAAAEDVDESAGAGSGDEIEEEGEDRESDEERNYDEEFPGEGGVEKEDE
jgi:DNA-directed RNA polymerase omega subunit